MAALSQPIHEHRGRHPKPPTSADSQVFDFHHPIIAATRNATKVMPISIQYRSRRLTVTRVELPNAVLSYRAQPERLHAMLRCLVLAALLTLASSSASAQTVRLDQYQHPSVSQGRRRRPHCLLGRTGRERSLFLHPAKDGHNGRASSGYHAAVCREEAASGNRPDRCALAWWS